MLIGYARTSTLEQEAGLEAQFRDLQALGCEKVIKEQTSSVGPRRGLDEALQFARSGDTLVVTKLDRLARSVPHMWEIVGRLKAKDVALRIVNMGIDTSTPTGKLMLNVIGGVAEFEREMMLERQREGIAKRRASIKAASPLLVPKPMRSRPSPLRTSAWVKSRSGSASAKVLSIGPSTPHESFGPGPHDTLWFCVGHSRWKALKF
jgi:DNA invertase Pin-like site-specific DNA recombinase